jgi:hypothetical protein
VKISWLESLIQISRFQKIEIERESYLVLQ